MDTLTSEVMCGRGCSGSGDLRAARFLASEFARLGMHPFNGEYCQPFSLQINTYQDSIHVAADSEWLDPGNDFVVLPYSPTAEGTYELTWFLSDSSGKPNPPEETGLTDLTGKVIITDLEEKEFCDSALQAAGIIFILPPERDVWWHVAQAGEVKDYFALRVRSGSIPEGTKTVTVSWRNQFYPDYKTQNVIGYLPGKARPGRFLVVTAHYDHLGAMGQVVFPGAHDNASGTSMMLDLARYFSTPEHRPDLSVAFMAFGAEEAGLLGSMHYIGHPLFPMDSISFLVNLDMVGSGSEGIMVVNGKVHSQEFSRLEELNRRHDYLVSVRSRGEAANSDHFPFHASGVPAFFIYTLGPECTEYHTIHDTPEKVPFTEYESFFKLLTGFIETFR